MRWTTLLTPLCDNPGFEVCSLAYRSPTHLDKNERKPTEKREVRSQAQGQGPPAIKNSYPVIFFICSMFQCSIT